MGEGDKLHSRRQQFIELIERERAVVAHGNEAEPGAGPFGKKLPWHQVTVVLHFGEQDHVAFSHESPAPGLCDEIDALGGATREYDLIGAGRTDVLRDTGSRAFIR